MKRFFESVVLGAITLFLCIGIGIHSAHATALYPAVTDVVLQPGSTTTTHISIGRDEPGAGDYVVSTLPFHPSADGHTIEWLSETDIKSLQTQVTVSQREFRLLEGEAKLLDVTMTAPTSSIQQGNEFVGILISSKQTQAGVVGTRLASLFFISFPTQAKPLFVATDIHIEPGHVWEASPSREVRVTIQNQGTGYGVPTGDIVTRNLFGKVVTVAPINPTESRVLAHASKTFQVHTDGFLFGRYTTRLERGTIQSNNDTLVWWAFPKTIIILLACIVLSIALAAIRRRSIH